MSDPGGSTNKGAFIGRADLIFFAFAFVFLYTQLFQLPFTPYYFEGDHMITISNAIRLYGGETMYRDFFHLTPPGGELFYASLFTLFGIKVWVLNLGILVLGLSLTALTWYFSRQLFSGVIVYLPATILLIVGFRLFFIDGSYRLFSVVFALLAIAVIFKDRTTKNLIVAGTLCGLASFYVQPRGVTALAGIMLFLLWETYSDGFNLKKLLRKVASVGLPFAITVIATQAYFVVQAGWENYYFSMVTFVRDHYPNDPLATRQAFLSDVPDLSQYLSIYSPLGAISRYFRVAAPTIFFYALVPWAYLIFLLFRWRMTGFVRESGTDKKLMLLSLTGLALSAGISAPSVYRLSHISIPAVLIFVWLFSKLKRASLVAAVLLTGLSLVGISYIIQRQTITKYFLDLPAGRAAFFSEPIYHRYKWISEHTRPGDAFFEAHHPSFYFPFHLIDPSPLYLVRDSEYTPIFQVQSVVKGLEKNPPTYIAWPRKWSKPAGERLQGDNLEPLWQYLQANYEFETEFLKLPDFAPYSEGDIEIWRRKN